MSDLSKIPDAELARKFLDLTLYLGPRVSTCHEIHELKGSGAVAKKLETHLEIEEEIVVRFCAPMIAAEAKKAVQTETAKAKKKGKVKP